MARSLRPSRSRPSRAAVERSTWAAFRVATIGRWRPVASAKEETSPVVSTTACSWTAKIVPELPSETTASPGPRPRPSAAAMLSPVPAEISRPSGVWPAGSAGPSTSGSRSWWPRASSTRSWRYSEVIGDQ